MSLFFRKKGVNLTEFCTSFYDANFQLQEPNTEYFRILKNQVAYVDKGFAAANFDNFFMEITTIKYECFGLAWFYKFGDKCSIDMNLITKDYLLANSLETIWENLGSYNNAGAESATHGSESSTAAGRAKLSFVNNIRVDLFRKYTSQGLDNFCVARALNRSMTKIELTVQFLIIHLSQKLNYDFNNEALNILCSRVFDFYSTSKEAIKDIKISK